MYLMRKPHICISKGVAKSGSKLNIHQLALMHELLLQQWHALYVVEDHTYQKEGLCSSKSIIIKKLSMCSGSDIMFLAPHQAIETRPVCMGVDRKL